MFASFEYELSKDEYASGLRVPTLALVMQDRWNALRCLSQLAVIALAVWISTLLRLASFDGIMLTLCLIAVPFLFMQARSARRWRGLSFEPDAASVRVSFDADGVVEKRDLAEWRWSWGGVRRLYDLPDAIVLQVIGWHLITLPNRLWPEPDERIEFIRQVRDRATNLLPDLPSTTVASPFTLINVGAGFGAVDIFLLQLLGVVYAATLPDWPLPMALNPRMIPSAFGILFAAVSALAVVSFFLIRGGLRALDRWHPRIASIIAAIFIAAFGAVLLASFLYRPCGC